MSAPRDDMAPEARVTAATSATYPWTRVFGWQIRRELWEHRSIYLAPLAGAGFALIGFLLSAWKLPKAMQAALIDPKKVDHLMMPFAFVSMAALLLGLLAAAFYSLEALHGERRDRSILFWKSLPVSDRISVLAKAAVPLLATPASILAVVFPGTLVVLVLMSLIAMGSGIDVGAMWSRMDLPFLWFMMVYGLAFLSLWYAPVVAWFLMVGAWAKRLPLLWATLPFMAVSIVEHTAFNSRHFYAWWVYRLGGGFGQVFAVKGRGPGYVDSLADLDPAYTFGNPDVWLGLIAAAVFIAVAIRLRRSRSPI